MTNDSIPQIFIDIEWEHAENSSGAPLSIGAVRSDSEASIYGRWPLRKKNCSQWTLMQVVPQLEATAEPASTAMATLMQWHEHHPESESESELVFWASEAAAAVWLEQNCSLNCAVWPGPRSEYESIKLWWSAQQWLDTHTRYHALWDARGMLEQWNKLQS